MDGTPKISIKKFGGTPPLLDCIHPVDVSRLSSGSAPFVPRAFCPIYVELHRKQVGTSWMCRDSPPNRPRDTPKAYRPPKSEVSKRGWREGGVGAEQAQNTASKSSQTCAPPSPKGAQQQIIISAVSAHVATFHVANRN